MILIFRKQFILWYKHNKLTSKVLNYLKLLKKLASIWINLSKIKYWKYFLIKRKFFKINLSKKINQLLCNYHVKKIVM